VPSLVEKDSACNPEGETDCDPKKGAEEASEYWPFLILGSRLKITDSLLALFTFFLIIVGIIQGKFLYRTDQGTRIAANAAKDSADVARKTLIASQRPWVSISVKVKSDLSWDKYGAHVSLGITYENIGKDPAFDVHIFPDYRLEGMHGAVQDELIKFADNIRNTITTNNMRGGAILPNDIVEETFNIWVQPNTKEAAIKTRGQIYFRPFALICVDYFSFITNQRHRIAKAIFVIKRQPLGSVTYEAIAFDETVEADGLDLFTASTIAD
jgi:hypothetical protein